MLEAGGSYANGATTWTPRPVVAAAAGSCPAAWFARRSSYTVAYSRRAPESHAQNFDLWRAQLQLDVRTVARNLHLPLIRSE